jgi:urease beta subunit
MHTTKSKPTLYNAEEDHPKKDQCEEVHMGSHVHLNEVDVEMDVFEKEVILEKKLDVLLEKL